MLILPAIDIIDTQCVRLIQGDYQRQKTYFKDPVEVAKNFEQKGAKFLHIVDLDGAKNGKITNQKTIFKISQETDLSIQVGGGIRDLETAKKLLDGGIERLILGTSAIKNPELVRNLIEKYGSERIIVSVDAKKEKILVEGWVQGSQKSLRGFLQELEKIGIKTIIFTDIKSDGMMKGPNLENIKKVLEYNFKVIVAGGVSSLKNLEDLDNLGVHGAIIGRALYEGAIDLDIAIKKFQQNNLAKRIIPCMDVDNGRVVKGTNFKDLKDAGDPVEIAAKYSESGADELVFLDITATVEKRKTLTELVKKIAIKINIPFTVGGGICSVEDIRAVLNSGADKVSLGSVAVRNPGLVREAAEIFGSQCIVISVDAKKVETIDSKNKNSWKIFIDGGRTNTGINALDFVKEMESLGAGELLVNSVDRDGTKQGYDLELLEAILRKVNIPVIASSGAGKMEDFLDAFSSGSDAALAASVFHYQEIEIPRLKQFLAENQITIRL